MKSEKEELAALLQTYKELATGQLKHDGEVKAFMRGLYTLNEMRLGIYKGEGIFRGLGYQKGTLISMEDAEKKKWGEIPKPPPHFSTPDIMNITEKYNARNEDAKRHLDDLVKMDKKAKEEKASARRKIDQERKKRQQAEREKTKFKTFAKTAGEAGGKAATEQVNNRLGVALRLGKFEDAPNRDDKLVKAYRILCDQMPKASKAKRFRRMIETGIDAMTTKDEHGKANPTPPWMTEEMAGEIAKAATSERITDKLKDRWADSLRTAHARAIVNL